MEVLSLIHIYFGGDYDIRKNENGATEGTYQITREDEKYLSVRFYSYWDFRWAAHPSWGERGVTVDRETGRRLALTDVVDFDGDGGALIRQYDWTPRWTCPGGEMEFLACLLYTSHCGRPHRGDVHLSEELQAGL